MFVAVSGAKIAGGQFNAMPNRPTVNGVPVLLVGDTTSCSAHLTTQTTTILAGGSKLFHNGVEIAHVGSPTSCGHPIIDPGPNTTLHDNTVS